MTDMNERETFLADLQAFVEGCGTKVAAADKANITRQDLHRYLKGKHFPRRGRMKRLSSLFQAAEPKVITESETSTEWAEISALTPQKVTALREYLLHLLHLLDLDERARRGTQRKDD